MPVPLHPEDGAETTTTKLAAALQALFSPEILILLGISNLTYLFGKITPQASAQPASAEGAGAGASATGATASNAAGHQAVEAVQLVPTHSGVGAAGPVG